MQNTATDHLAVRVDPTVPRLPRHHHRREAHEFEQIPRKKLKRTRAQFKESLLDLAL